MGVRRSTTFPFGRCTIETRINAEERTEKKLPLLLEPYLGAETKMMTVVSYVVATVKGEQDPEQHAVAPGRPNTLCGLAESSIARREERFELDLVDACDLCAAEARSSQ